MNTIILNNIEYIKTDSNIKIPDGVWYDNHWYKVKTKYKVQSLLYCDRIFYKHVSDDNQFNCNDGGTINFLGEKLEIGNRPVHINSIIRLADNNLFTLNDDTNFGKIQAINIINHRYIANMNNTLMSCDNLNKVLLISEDGLKIYDGDRVFFINKNKKIDAKTIVAKTIDTNIIKYYSSYNNADKALLSELKYGNLIFGGEKVTFDVVLDSCVKHKEYMVNITCKGIVGNHWDVEQILNYYFRPCKFGEVELKSFSINNNYINNNLFFPIDKNNDENIVNEITIGCLTGKYIELVKIHKFCLELLKQDNFNNGR